MPESKLSIVRLILVPSIITLAVTVLRLVGELQGWSRTFFNPVPGGWMAIVGIVWLVPIFGIYFAVKLAAAGLGPPGAARSIGLAVLGFVVFAVGWVLLNRVFAFHFRYLALMWLLGLVGAVIQIFAWPALFKVLLAYGYAARIPVAIIMFLATENVWESHYSALVASEAQIGEFQQYLLFGLIPQLVWWVCFTIVVGTLFGSVAATFVRGGKAATQAA